MSGRTMVLWDGFCPTHVRITPDMIVAARKTHPAAAVLIHPEAPKASRDLADHVFSTGGMCDFVKTDPGRDYIIATETGIIHTLTKQNPEKRFFPVSDQALCPNMKKMTLDKVKGALEGSCGMVVTVPAHIAEKARKSLVRMLVLGK
jgi:quinolinate synthase